MTQSLSSNLGLNLPVSYRTSSNKHQSWCSFPLGFRPPQSFKPHIKAMAGEASKNLDHMHRLTKHQSRPKKRVAPVAPIGLWDRFPTARTVQEMMETMMEDPFAFSTGEWPSSPMPSQGSGGYRRGRTPWDIKEGEGEYRMRFDMPGMSKEDVKVWVEEKMLVVKAEKAPHKKKNREVVGEEQEQEQEEEEEWSAKIYGRYNSRIALPENVQFENIKAEVKDGVLYITIPKATASPKILDIDVQ